MTAKIGIIMGSASDIPVVEKGTPILEELGIEFEVAIASAHRTPADVENYAKGARRRGIRAIIAVAGRDTVNNGTIEVRDRNGENAEAVPVADAAQAIADRVAALLK